MERMRRHTFCWVIFPLFFTLRGAYSLKFRTAGACRPIKKWVEMGVAEHMHVASELDFTGIPVEDGAVIKFKCDFGYTIDGFRTGSTEVNVKCENHSFMLDKICEKAIACGSAPFIEHATHLGVVKAIEAGEITKAKYECDAGHSLDGEKVVENGLGENKFFSLKCENTKENWESFEGKCKSLRGLDVGDMAVAGLDATEKLFVATCRLMVWNTTSRGEKKDFNTGFCNKLDNNGACDAAATQVKDALTKLDGDEKGVGKKVNDDIVQFCSDLWKIHLPAEF